MLENTAVESVETEETESPRGRGRSRTRSGGKELDFYAKRRVRTGKTRKDHESGAWRRNQDNVRARGDWANEVRGKITTPPPMITPHGNGNSCIAFKLKPDKISKG